MVIVIKNKVAKGDVLRQEVYEGRLGVQTEGVVRQVDSVEIRKGK